MMSVTRRSWFDEVVAAHEHKLVAFARRWVGSMAKDLVQEALLRLWQSELQPGATVTAWLYRVVRNLAIDESRKVRTIGEAAAEFGVWHHVAAEDRMGLEAGARKVLERVATLPPRQQEVVRLKLVDELSYQEIGDVLGLTATNVGFILNAAMKTLRNEVADIVPDFVRRRA